MSDLKERLRDAAEYFEQDLSSIHAWSFTDEQRPEIAKGLREAADAIERMEKDAKRYRWVRDRAAIEDVERWQAEVPLGARIDENESLKTDAAIDAARGQNG